MNCNPYQEYLGYNQGAIGGIQADFAENNICGYIGQPSNVVSSLVYLVFGLILITRYKRWDFGILLSLVGVGSVFLHATSTNVGQVADFASIFILVTYFLYNTLKNSYYSNLISKLIVSSILFIQLMVLIYLRTYRIAVLAIVLVSLLLLENKSIKKLGNRSAEWSKGWGLFIIAFGIWLLDEFRIWDNDSIEHFINAHSIWHMLTAYCLFLVSKYYILSPKKNED